MKLALPSGATVEIADPAKDFPDAIAAAELREEKAREDIKVLKRCAKQIGAWPVTGEEKGGV